MTKNNIPKAVGPYSPAVVIGNLIFVSGQIGKDPENDSLKEGIREQTRQVLINMENILKAAGANLNSVVKTTCYLINMDDYVEFNAVYAECFSKPYPARATIAVTKLPKKALVEIECIAVINDSSCCGKKEGNGGCCGKCRNED